MNRSPILPGRDKREEMDCLSPLFLFDQIDDFLQFSPPPPPPLLPLNPPPNLTPRRKVWPAVPDHRPYNVTLDGGDENPTEKNSNKKRKLMHRDVERQRRHDMSNLYRALRSLLPLDYVKGKRSMSDHMNEAAKYVKDLQKKMELLNEKRDELLRNNPTMTVTSSIESTTINITAPPSKNQIKVESCSEKMSIIVNLSSIGGLPLSRIIRALMEEEEEELTVVNCSSTKVNERLLHSIQCEVSNGRKIDPSKLQQKLECLICF